MLMTIRNGNILWKPGKLLSILLAVGIFLAGSTPVFAAPRVQSVDDRIVIVIDPGHGGINEGTTENGFQEKSMTMTTAMAMYEELCKYDNVEVYLTRTADVNLSLEERAQYAKSVDADFLFSIHYNASLCHEMYGTEVWISAYAPYNAYGYQFGCVQMETMQDMGLFLRGIKTRLNDKGDADYYGIIRESAALSVPAAIIEHCHVDQKNDVPFCDSEEDLIAFGKADARSVAKYFGLKSSELGVDYSEDSLKLAEVSEKERVKLALYDETDPDICQITLQNADYDACEATFEISAADYDSMLLYYDYSLDGGETYSARFPWPGCNVLDGTYTDIFTTTLQIPSGTQPKVIFRAYNLYDLDTESNSISFPQSFLYKEPVEEKETQTDSDGNNAVAVDGQAVMDGQGADESGQEEKTVFREKQKSLGTTTFRPDEPLKEEEKEVGLLDFLMVCLVIVAVLFVIVLVSQIISERKRRQRRRQARKDAGDDTYQSR